MEILILAHQKSTVAQELHKIWQRSYPIEARLIGVKDFPPLNRNLEEFRRANTQFIGIRSDSNLIAALEFEFLDGNLCINSLVVDPDHLRRGYGKKLMEHVLGSNQWQKAKIETGAANAPAIRLYQKLGFEITETYIADMNISKVKMELVM